MKTSTRARAVLAGGAVLLLAAGYFVGRWSATGAPSADLTVSHQATRSVAQRPITVPPREKAIPVSPIEEAAPQGRAAWDKRWKELQARPASAAREKAMAAALRELAATDADAALGLARQEVNLRVRQALIGASLAGWATVNPEASVGWAAENLFDAERRMAVETIIEAGMVRRDETMAAIGALCEKDAAMADDYGRMLIAALSSHADFDSAMRFAAGSDSGHRDYWLGAAMYSWSQYRPAEAAEALKNVVDPAAYNEAVHGLILGWSSNDPVSLVKFAERMPPGPARQEAFNQALQNWVTHDPVAASAWLDEHEATPELDSGAVKLATSPFLVANNLETALSWARSVSDSQQRTIALVDVIQQWAQRDPVAARLYAESLGENDIQADYRTMLMKELGQAAAPR